MHILIVKMSSLGDIIHAFPVLDYLKQSHPDIKIDWVVELPFADLVRAHPFIHRTICVETKKWRSQLLKKTTWQEGAKVWRDLRTTSYDLVLDLQGNSKSAIVTACAKSRLKVGFGFRSVPEWPNLLSTHQRHNPPLGQNIREDYLFIAQSALNHFISCSIGGVQLQLTQQEEIKLKPILEHVKQIKKLKVLVCPGSNWTNKQLSQETLRSFLQSFSHDLNPHFFFIWGNPVEKGMAEEAARGIVHKSSLIEKLSLPALQNLMTHVDLVLAMDSLPLHLAGTTSTPTYSIFGASLADKYRPIGEHHAAFQGSCPYGKTFEKRCDVLRTCQTGACIKQLEGKQLFDHFFAWWSDLDHVRIE